MRSKEQNNSTYARVSERSAGTTYREDNRDTTSHGFRAVQVSFVTEKQIFFSVCRLPRDYGSAIEKDFDPITRGQGGDDARVVVRDRNLWGRRERGDWNGGWLLRALNHLALDFLRLD